MSVTLNADSVQVGENKEPTVAELYPDVPPIILTMAEKLRKAMGKTGHVEAVDVDGALACWDVIAKSLAEFMWGGKPPEPEYIEQSEDPKAPTFG